MPNSKKKRTAKSSPNTVGTQRANQQAAQANNNLLIKVDGGRTPWQKAKDKRRHLRILAGKPTQFMRRQAAKSNYKQTGKNKVADQIKPGTGIAYDDYSLLKKPV